MVTPIFPLVLNQTLHSWCRSNTIQNKTHLTQVENILFYFRFNKNTESWSSSM